MKLSGVNISLCEEGCESIDLSQCDKSVDSIMWEYEGVDIELDAMRVDELDRDPREDCMDVFLDCGCVLGYVEVDEFYGLKTDNPPEKVEKLKMFVYRPEGFGQDTFFVMAKNKEVALKKIRGHEHFEDIWDESRYEIEEYEEGQISTNGNS